MGRIAESEKEYLVKILFLWYNMGRKKIFYLDTYETIHGRMRARKKGSGSDKKSLQTSKSKRGTLCKKRPPKKAAFFKNWLTNIKTRVKIIVSSYNFKGGLVFCHILIIT